MKVFILSSDVSFPPAISDGAGRIVSVSLREGRNKENWRCNSCGKIVFQYTGKVGEIFDGAIKTEEKPTIDALCHRCKIIYRVFVIK